MWSAGLCIAALVLVSITHWIYRWNNLKCNGTLPPGSIGWPLLGETLHFFTPNPTWDTPFIKNRIERYGSIFRTSLFGLQVVMSTDLELNHMLFQQEDQLTESWYPRSVTKIFGSQNIGSVHGNTHKYLKNMILTIVGPENLKKIFTEVESVATRNMEAWASKETVELKTIVADMILELMGKKLISYDPKKSSENLRESFDAFIHGIISFPLDIPGTAHHKCLQGRKKVLMMLKKMLEERRAKPHKVKNDFFDYVLEELNQDDTFLTEPIALDFMFALLYVNFETTSQAIIGVLPTTKQHSLKLDHQPVFLSFSSIRFVLEVAIKLLTDNPRALKELTEEHEKLRSKRKTTESGLAWEEYKSMTFTFQIINETLRLANIVPILFRKALKEIKFKEYTIPSGWVIVVCPPAVHLDPINYKDPLNFDPWRWEGRDFKGASRTFMAFGGGLRFCVGAEFARLQMAVFLHCLVTKYRWKLVKGGEIVRNPCLQFQNGFHVRFSGKDNENQEQASDPASYRKEK